MSVLARLAAVRCRMIFGHSGSFSSPFATGIGSRSFSASPTDLASNPMTFQRFRANNKDRQEEKRRLRRFLWPFPLVTFFLGTWQVYRLQWKEELIELCEERMNGDAEVAMPSTELLLESDAAMNEYEYARVRLRGRYLSDCHAFLYPRFSSGAVGVHLLTPFLRTDIEPNELILVNRGWIAEDLLLTATPRVLLDDPDPDISPNNAEEGKTKTHDDRIIRAYIRRLETGPPNAHTPAHEPEKGRWYWADGTSILLHVLRGSQEKLEDLAIYPLIVDAVDDGPDGVPKGNQTIVNLRNSHMNYILTWYGLTAALIWMLV